MRLNHIDIHVADVAATADFFVRHLGLRLQTMRGTAGLAILADDTGLELVISHPIEKFGGIDQEKLGSVSYHIGFIQPTRQAVDILYERLDAAGAELWSPPRALRGGWVFYCMAPGRVLVEIGWRG